MTQFVMPCERTSPHAEHLFGSHGGTLRCPGMARRTLMPWAYHDGGRADAGFQGEAGDCFTRAVAIATGRPYREVYDEVAEANQAAGRTRSAREGVLTKTMRMLMERWGFPWTATMHVGSGCTTHLDTEELPGGVLVARLSRHVVAVRYGMVLDTGDPRREGSRCVYGFWTVAGETSQEG